MSEKKQCCGLTVKGDPCKKLCMARSNTCALHRSKIRKRCRSPSPQPRELRDMDSRDIDACKEAAKKAIERLDDIKRKSENNVKIAKQRHGQAKPSERGAMMSWRI